MKNILKTKIEKSHLLVLTVLILAAASFSVIQLTTASPAVPNPGHSYNQIELPAGTWTGLDADKLDGKHANEIGTGAHYKSAGCTSNGFVACSTTATCDAGGVIVYAVSTNFGSAWCKVAMDPKIEFGPSGNVYLRNDCVGNASCSETSASPSSDYGACVLISCVRQ